MDFRRRQRLKRAAFSRVTVALLAFVVLMLARGVWGIYQKERDTAAKLDQAVREEGELEARKTFLEREVIRLRTREGVEEEVRENFGLGKEGERVIIVVPHDDGIVAGVRTDSGIWEWLKRLFKRD